MEDYATKNLFNFNDVRYDHNFSQLYHRFFNNGIPKQGTTWKNISTLYSMLYSRYPIDTKMVLHKNEQSYKGLIRVAVNVPDTDDISLMYEELKDDKDVLNMYNTVVTGDSVVMKMSLDILEKSQIRSLIVTLIASLFVLTLIFFIKEKSILLGGITLLPVVLCVVWILGSMYLFGIPLNVMTVTIASLTVGLGVTYGIHITHRFTEEIKEKNLINASESTVLHTGSALFGAAATTIAGFGILVFAIMPPLQQFGSITALTILYSFIASTFILPTVLVIWAKKNNKK
jgi:predicted RND superfamily exporter protein